jgi:hypothetical protein
MSIFVSGYPEDPSFADALEKLWHRKRFNAEHPSGRLHCHTVQSMGMTAETLSNLNKQPWRTGLLSAILARMSPAL